MVANIKLKRSAISGRVPDSADLDYGELAINYADGKLYYKSVSNEVNSISGGGATTDSAAPLTNLSEGDLWWDATSGRLKIYYNDGDPSGASPQTITLTSSNSGASDYTFSGSDRTSTYSSTSDPNITIIAGDTLEVTQNTDLQHPMWWVTQLSLSNSYDAQYNIAGVTNNGGYGGQVISYTFSSPGTYYYICQYHPDMVGTITVLDAGDIQAQWVDATPSARGYTGSAGNVLFGQTAPSNPSDGTIWYDSKTGRSYFWYVVAGNGQWVLMSDPTVTDGDTGYTGSVGFVGSRGVISPRLLSFNQPQVNEQQTLLFNDDKITVQEVRGTARGGFSATYSLVFDSSRNNVGTTIATDVIDDSAFGNLATISNAVVPRNTWIWARLSDIQDSTTNVMDEVAINVRFNK